jgi:excisionase family DNA binding protein
VSTNALEELRTLTVEELSTATGIAVWRIYEMLRKGKAPPHFKVGSTYRFPFLGVRTWLTELASGKQDGAA